MFVLPNTGPRVAKKEDIASANYPCLFYFTGHLLDLMKLKLPK